MIKRIVFILCVAAMTFFFSGVTLMASDTKVNINTATVEELVALKGIGEAYAKAIVDYRTAHGNFKAPEEITNVKGIGEKIYEANKDRILVEDPKP